MNEAQSVMTFDRAKLHDLEVSIARAKREHVEVFQFYGQTLLLRYAEYMAQYLRQQFGMPPTHQPRRTESGRLTSSEGMSMKVKVSEATPIQLDWMVVKCEGRQEPELLDNFAVAWCTWPSTHYSTKWAHGGPLLTREHISRTIDHSGLWIAYWTDGYTEGDAGKKWMQCDRSELVAGLRCYVASKLGDEVDVPEELT